MYNSNYTLDDWYRRWLKTDILVCEFPNNITPVDYMIKHFYDKQVMKINYFVPKMYLKLVESLFPDYVNLVSSFDVECDWLIIADANNREIKNFLTKYLKRNYRTKLTLINCVHSSATGSKVDLINRIIDLSHVNSCHKHKLDFLASTCSLTDSKSIDRISVIKNPGKVVIKRLPTRVVKSYNLNSGVEGERIIEVLKRYRGKVLVYVDNQTLAEDLLLDLRMMKYSVTTDLKDNKSRVLITSCHINKFEPDYVLDFGYIKLNRSTATTGQIFKKSLMTPEIFLCRLTSALKEYHLYLPIDELDFIFNRDRTFNTKVQGYLGQYNYGQDVTLLLNNLPDYFVVDRVKMFEKRIIDQKTVDFLLTLFYCYDKSPVNFNKVRIVVDENKDDYRNYYRKLNVKYKSNSHFLTLTKMWMDFLTFREENTGRISTSVSKYVLDSKVRDYDVKWPDNLLLDKWCQNVGHDVEYWLNVITKYPGDIFSLDIKLKEVGKQIKSWRKEKINNRYMRKNSSISELGYEMGEDIDNIGNIGYIKMNLSEVDVVYPGELIQTDEVLYPLILKRNGVVSMHFVL